MERLDRQSIRPRSYIEEGELLKRQIPQNCMSKHLGARDGLKKKNPQWTREMTCSQKALTKMEQVRKDHSQIMVMALCFMITHYRLQDCTDILEACKLRQSKLLHWCKELHFRVVSKINSFALFEATLYLKIKKYRYYLFFYWHEYSLMEQKKKKLDKGNVHN